MANVVILGAGVMGSAMAAPLADNGHDVRLVGTHLDREIVDTIRSTGVHPGLGRDLPAAVRAYQLEEVEASAVTDAEGRNVAVVETTRETSAANRWVAPVICRPTLSPGWPSNGGNIFDTNGNVSP